jgi:hypothetical protein
MDDRTAFFDKITEMTKKTQQEITKIYIDSRLEKHSEIRSMFMKELGLSYGFANTLTHYVTKTDGASLSEGKTINQVLDEIYFGEKEKFRTIHDFLMKKIEIFGKFEIAPKKGYLSLKQKKQFATIGPKTNSRMEIGINGKNILGGQRLLEQPKGSMCQYIVRIVDIKEIDDELIFWLHEAYNQSI